MKNKRNIKKIITQFVFNYKQSLAHKISLNLIYMLSYLAIYNL